jgi:hypothetical protein
MKKVIVEKETWFIVESETQHFGKLQSGHAYETDKNVLTFDNEEDWEKELKKRGLTSNLFKLPNIEKK